MYYLNNMGFSTYDAIDHDNSQCSNCVAHNGGGFCWNDWKNRQNFNGHYSGSSYSKWHKMRWDHHFYLKKRQLMIRPAADN